MMNISYFKRFKMEIELDGLPAVPALPAGYSWIAWDPSLIACHAEVKYLCFQEEIDATVFPSLGSRDGCTKLMTEISRKHGFQPLATWLVACGETCCATVQGVRDRTGMGAIQNLGVTAPHRGLGIGEAILLQALHGFHRAGISRGILEVTAQNEAAVRLYRRVGFRCRKTVYKAVEGELARPAMR